MINKLNVIRKKQGNKEENGVAMVIAVLIIMIMVTLVTFMSAYAVRAIQKGNTVQSLSQSSNAADTAIAHMMTLANSKKNSLNNVEIEKHIGIGNAVYGNFHANELNSATGDGGYSWRWYAEKAPNTSVGTSYIIHATGYKDSPEEANARTIEVTIESTTVERVIYKTNGEIDYVSTVGGLFTWGVLTANGSLEMKNGSKVYTYDSNTSIGYPSTSATFGDIATTNAFTLGTDVKLNRLNFLLADTSANPSNDRCSGTGCSGKDFNSYIHGISMLKSREEALAACPNSTYPNWVASENSGTIAYSTTTKCYNNIVFDVDTSLPSAWTTGNPAKMYAKGSIAINSGVEVGKQNLMSQGPYALRIISSGSSTFNMAYGTSTNPTKLTGVVAGAGLTCNIGKDATSTAHVSVVYGSIACSSAVLHPYSQVWWDKQLEKSLKEGSIGSVKIWNTTSYEEK